MLVDYYVCILKYHFCPAYYFCYSRDCNELRFIIIVNLLKWEMYMGCLEQFNAYSHRPPTTPTIILMEFLFRLVFVNHLTKSVIYH